MKSYEILYIIDATTGDEKREEIISKVKALVEGNGGTAQEPEKWGVRKFAYPINYKTEGYYVLMNFEANETVPHALDSQLQILEGIIRHMIVAKN